MKWWGDNITQTLQFFVLFNMQNFNQWTNFDLSLRQFHDLGAWTLKDWPLYKRKRDVHLPHWPRTASVWVCTLAACITTALKLSHGNRNEDRVSALRPSQGRTTCNIWLTGLPRRNLEKSYDPPESALRLSCGNPNKPSFSPPNRDHTTALRLPQ